MRDITSNWLSYYILLQVIALGNWTGIVIVDRSHTPVFFK